MYLLAQVILSLDGPPNLASQVIVVIVISIPMFRSKKNCEKFPFLQHKSPALYSTYDGSRQGYFFYVGGNENKNKFSWLADVGGEQIKKGKLSN